MIQLLFDRVPEVSRIEQAVQIAIYCLMEIKETHKGLTCRGKFMQSCDMCDRIHHDPNYGRKMHLTLMKYPKD